MAEFWELTPFEVKAVFDACVEQQAEKIELAYYTAYHSGLFSQQYTKNKFPKYDDNRPSKKKKAGEKKMTWQQQKMYVIALNAALGGTINKRGEA